VTFYLHPAATHMSLTHETPARDATEPEQAVSAASEGKPAAEQAGSASGEKESAAGQDDSTASESKPSAEKAESAANGSNPPAGQPDSTVGDTKTVAQKAAINTESGESESCDINQWSFSNLYSRVFSALYRDS